MVTGGGLTDSWHVSRLKVFLFFRPMLEINFLMSSGIITNLHDVLQLHGLSILEVIMSVTRLDITSYLSPMSVY